MRTDGDLIAIRTCCGYVLLRLVIDRLQPWKHIKNIQHKHFNSFANWMLSNGQLIGIDNRRDLHGMRSS